MFYELKFIPSQKNVCMDENKTIMDAIIAAGIKCDYPCGGNGTCGKCLVDINVNGDVKTVKACQTKVFDNMTVTLKDEEALDKVLISSIGFDVDIDPIISTELINEAKYGVAFDIGTTTIAASLLNLLNGEVIESIGQLNNQVKYGADVVSRCLYAQKNGVLDIQKCVLSQSDEMINELIKNNNLSIDDIAIVSIVGNTCMQHIFAGINPTSLVEIPYMPTVYDSMIKPAKEYLTNVNSKANLVILPVIAGFVGADTVAVMLATKFFEKSSPTLLLDIGTNGEMALGTKDKWVACSTASGPAFEGAKILFGMRGSTGAIDHVKYIDDELTLSVIDNVKAKGICGSGLIDIISILLNTEVILKSGRFNKKYEGPLIDRIKDIDGIKCFVLTEDVYITQKDIREVQLAKAAIAAGIKIMSDTLEISFDDINEVLIAGAFGNYMDPISMCNIKLVPPSLLPKIKPIGNAALEGSKLGLLSKSQFELSEFIAKKTEFLELASLENFQDIFVSQLDF